MKKLAMGIITAASLLCAAPALAQIGFYAGPGGVGVQVAPSYGYYDSPYRYYRAEPRYYRRDRYWRERGWRDRREDSYGYGWDSRSYRRDWR
jgi:hypothetical protein